MSAPIVIARFSFPYEAQIARASLDAAGIPAFIADEHTVNMNWLYSNALGGVRLLVPRQHAQEAKALLAADFSEQLELEQATDPAVCPNCGSDALEAHTQGKKPAFLVFLLLGFPLFFYRHGLRCTNCGTFWQN
ncbi:MAG TPA: DUF2007 domain-containing protein [Gammaproteobacteria bacterium]|nr:DUF2007 domain-containing protein [Gammaproteobacteria bacterium]